MTIKLNAFSVGQVVLVMLLILAVSLGYKNNLSYPTATFAETTFKLEIARTPEERQLGLSGRTSLKNDEGMLFVFEKPGLYSFWMKDMKFDLDILWLNSQGRVVQIYTYVSPYDFPKSYTSELPASYVLEINGGAADTAGIEFGDFIQLEGI